MAKVELKQPVVQEISENVKDAQSVQKLLLDLIYELPEVPEKVMDDENW